MPFRRPGRATWYVTLKTPTGEVRRSAETRDRATAKAIERTIRTLESRREWELLNAVVDKTITVGELFDAATRNDLQGLRRRLDDVDLEPHVAQWELWLADRVRPDTAAHYSAHLRTLIPAGKPFLRSAFTAPVVTNWMASRTRLPQKRKPGRSKPRRTPDAQPRPISGATRRKYLAAVQSFAKYLVSAGVLTTNPTRDVQAPPPSKPRVVEIHLANVKRIFETALPPFRALFALLYGAGIEISAALACVETDVDTKRREIRARGTKAHTRDRVVRVAEWAWPFIKAHIDTLTPGERLFRGIDRWQAGEVHTETLRILGLPHHRLHDARHFYAVRAVRAGTPYELVARQLGHADVQMVSRVYGRYAPRSDERDRWERIAAKQDAERDNAARKKAKAVCTIPCTIPAAAENEKSRKPHGPRDLHNSRGGTRTHDPGIMSAVL
jgi:integrase